MIDVKPIGKDAFVIVVDGATSMEAFKELIQRGANLWPDASAEVKEFSDQITNGKVLQDYRKQNNESSIYRCEHYLVRDDCMYCRGY